jgi:hypothetical protein
VGLTSADISTSPDQLVLPEPTDLGTMTNTRQVSFDEFDSDVLPGVAPRIGLLVLVDLSNPATPAGLPLR